MDHPLREDASILDELRSEGLLHLLRCPHCQDMALARLGAMPDLSPPPAPARLSRQARGSTRRRFLEKRRLAEAALATLDLAVLFEETRRRDKVERLIAELEDGSRGLGGRDLSEGGPRVLVQERVGAGEAGARRPAGGDSMDQSGAPAMSDAEEAAQSEVFETVAGLKGMRFKLLGVCSTLPESTPGREIIECVLADAIVPAIRDLTAAAEQLAEGDEDA